MLLCRRSKNLDSDKIEEEAAMSSITVASFLRDLHKYPEYKDATKSQQREFLQFVMEVVKQDLAVHAASGLLAYDISPSITLFPVNHLETDEDRIPFDGNTVVAQTHKRSSLFQAVSHIKAHGFDSRLNTTTGFYFPDWNLILIQNGIHHAAVASVLRKNGTADCKVIHLRDIYPEVSLTERMDYWVLSSGQHIPVREPRIALLYAISRELDGQ